MSDLRGLIGQSIGPGQDVSRESMPDTQGGRVDVALDSR